MHWEVELKFAASDFHNVQAQFSELGLVFSPPVQQTDHYFNHPARDFSQTDEALRIRQIGAQNLITYKGSKVDPSSKTRRELEIPLPDGRNTSVQFAELLKALGFRHAGTVTKSRRTADFSWQNHKVTVALDDVLRLGTFVELEISADDGGLESAKSVLQALAQTLELREPERKSYLELVLEKNP